MKEIKKITMSLILVVSILVTGLKLDVIAGEIYETKRIEKNESGSSDEATIVKELTSERTENSNTYLMSDGSKRLEIYNGNIRYWDNGEMIDYDSSLTKISKSERTKLKKIANEVESEQIEKYEYVNTQGDTRQYFAKSLSEKTPIILTKDNYSIQFMPSVESDLNDEVGDDEQIIKCMGIKNDKNKISYENEEDKINYEYYSLNNGVWCYVNI